ncbi:MAG: hypothetical protein INR62_01390 [Rhodospirillales bacterium]|nr:hypothetical protein [Acetobacter sp.]
MGEPQIVGALRDKRAELSGFIADLEKRMAQHRADLMHVDAVLLLFAPELEVTAVAPKAVRRRNEWFRPGELPRTVLDILRVAPAPLPVREIAIEVMARRGLDAGDGRTLILLRKLVQNALARQAAELVERVVDGAVVRWRVAA